MTATLSEGETLIGLTSRTQRARRSFHRRISALPWGPWERILAAVTTVALALAALLAGLNQTALAIATGLVAVIGAMLGLAIAIPRARAETLRANSQAARRTRVPIAQVKEVDLTAIGVAPAAETSLRSGPVPEYVPRKVDESIVRALKAGLHGEGPWIIVAVGSSKVGKSRSLFQGLLTCSDDTSLELVAPCNLRSFEEIMEAGSFGGADGAHHVLWLDDLEDFVSQGMTIQTLRAWRACAPNSVVVATFGGRGGGSDVDSDRATLLDFATAIVLEAATIRVDPTSAAELEPIRDRLSQSDRRSVERHGLAAFLVAAPRLELKLNTGRHNGGPECPEGVAIVHAAVDWARCGRTDGIPDPLLRDLWPSYLRPGVASSDQAFARGLDWAERPVSSTIALLDSGDGHRAYDYVVQFVADNSAGRNLPDAAWKVAVRDATDWQALTVGTRAFEFAQYEAAEVACRQAGESDIDIVSGSARANLGAALVKRGREEEALEVFAEVRARFAGAPEPQLRALVGHTMVNEAIALTALERYPEAYALHDDLLRLFGDASDPELQTIVTTALYNRGNALVDEGRLPEALAAYELALAQFSGTSGDHLRLSLTEASMERARTLAALGMRDAAAEAFRQLVAESDLEDGPRICELAAEALFSLGVVEAELDNYDRAGAAYQQLVERFGAMPEPAIQQWIGKGLINQARIGDADEALATYEAVVNRFGDSAAPILQELVAHALVNRGIRFQELGRPTEAIESYAEVASMVSDDSPPALRAQLARALVNRGIAIKTIDGPDAALGSWTEVVERFGAESDESVRIQVANALSNLGATLSGLQRIEQAIEAYERLEGSFTDDYALKVERLVAEAMLHKAILFDGNDNADGALRSCEEIIERFGNADDEDLRVLVAGAMVTNAVRLMKQRQYDSGIRVCDMVIARLADAESAKAQGAVVNALTNKGIALASLGNAAASRDAFRDALARVDRTTTAHHEDIAKGLLGAGNTFLAGQRPADALSLFFDVHEDLGGLPDAWAVAADAQASFRAAEAFVAMDRPEDALGDIGIALARLGDRPKLELRELRAEGLTVGAMVLEGMDRADDALAALSEVVIGYADAPEPELQLQVGAAHFNRARLLARLNRVQPAIRDYEAVVARLAQSSEPIAIEMTRLAAQQRDELARAFSESTD